MSSEAVSVADKPVERFRVKEWKSVAQWSWDIVVDTCAICRGPIMELCLDCQANNATAKDCTVFLIFLIY